MMKSFARLLEDYILVYLMKERRVSKCTVHSYYAAMEQYTVWLREEKTLEDGQIDASCFSKEYIKEFLSFLEERHSVSASTYNLRKAGIQSFLDYASEVEPVYINASRECRGIKGRKPSSKPKTFLTADESG